MHMGDPVRQDTVAAEREKDSRRAENIARHKTGCGNGRARQQQEASEVSEKRNGGFGKRRRCFIGKLRPQGSLRHQLNQNVKSGRDREGEIDCARHGSRRIFHFAARNERDFDAEEREEQKQNGIAECLRAGPAGPCQRSRFDEEHADGHEHQKRNELRDGDDTDRAGAGPHAANINRGKQRIDNKHQRGARRRTAKPRRQRHDGAGKKIHYRRDAQQCGRAEKQTGDETDIASERHFGISVESARERDAAARESETSHEQSHRDPAGDERKRRRRAQSLGDERRQREDTRADRGVDDVRGQAGDANRADQLRIGVARRFPGHPETLTATADRDKSVIPSEVEESRGASIDVLRGSSTSLGMTELARVKRTRSQTCGTWFSLPTMRDSHLEDYYSFLRFPSVSTDEAYAGKVKECAEWLVKKLQAIGLETQLVPTAGHPVVWARNKHQPGRRSVMIYGHYDVQPPDPLELWESPPFEPVLKNGYVFARGATDNKGQILSHILGVQEALEQNGDLPVNLHFVIEGEEEIGSGNLGKFLSDNREALQCDVAVVSDTGMVARGVPTLSYGLRGVTALEVKITGAKMDLHSGVFGGAVANPITALARLLATLHDENAHVAIEGFYDTVKPLEDWERKAWRELPVDGDKAILVETGAPALFGEKGYSTLERIWGRPTAEINGIGGGYQGVGTKTVIASHPLAKLTFRLVPNQEGDNLLALAERHLKKH